jgi:hypothetical protein
MNSAKLREERIKIYKPVTVTTDYGDFKEEITFVTECRAGVLTQQMNREFSNDQISYPETRTLLVRNYVPIDDGYVIRWDKKWWMVESYIRNKYFNNIEITIKKYDDPSWNWNYEGD